MDISFNTLNSAVLSMTTKEQVPESLYIGITSPEPAHIDQVTKQNKLDPCFCRENPETLTSKTKSNPPFIITKTLKINLRLCQYCVGAHPQNDIKALEV